MYSAKTDLGRKRSLNEDNYAVLASQNLFVVADGMGGHAAGEVASKIAVETMKEFINVANQDQEITWPFDINLDLPEEANQLETAIKLANNRIYQTALEQQKLEGMGTTIVGLIYNKGIAYIGHVGDSRAYLVRENKIKPLTFDHSWVNVQVMLGEITKDEARNHPMKNIITRALGTKENVEVDLQTERVQDQDVIILCSDGLSGLIEDEVMKHVILENLDDLNVSSEKLISIANENGGDDNITLILIKFVSEEGDEKFLSEPQEIPKDSTREDEITEVIYQKDIEDHITEDLPLDQLEIRDVPEPQDDQDDVSDKDSQVIETMDDFEKNSDDAPPSDDQDVNND
ncbi:Stp1/IreP family PP2C-type Ser/Thr phosphatase [candidate division CSSED10-310 bacterium]|uniref:Stp1/IreP family PP2C-type Ser/Thr phosphatase n=1 Tax=candidate division CSSED10-310 bacterium TaxID=2855610 RepID=A0ABV6YXI4_UNCC1